MSALAAARNTPSRATQGVHATYFRLKMKASTTIHKGSMVAVDDTTGLAEPATGASAKTVIGVAEESVTSASSGTFYVQVRRGVFLFANKAGDLVTDAMLGRALAYVEDDQTVRATGTGSVVAGKVIEVETAGVWVEFA
jgi:transcription elongation GreA/GreB family factor